jgi:hypothetical protein
MAEEKKNSGAKAEVNRFDIGGYTRGLSAEERQANASKAGKASGAARRAHRPMREVLKTLMAMDTSDPDMHDILTKLGLEPTNDNAVALAQILQATQKREAESARFIRDTLGEKPTEQYNLAVNKPIQSMELGTMTDEELAALADRAE